MRFSKGILAGLAALVALPASAGGIKGVVQFAGTAPKLAALKATKDTATCGSDVPDESLRVSNGKLGNVVIMVKGGTARAKPRKIVLDQLKCRYGPHVQAAGTGSSLDILNSDPVLHNIHGYLGTATTFNLAMPPKHQKLTRKLDKPGLVRLQCDVHAWMNGYIVISDAPFAVSGKDGAFAVRNVPPGRYTVTAWHEKLGEKTAEVTVPETGDATANFSFGG